MGTCDKRLRKKGVGAKMMVGKHIMVVMIQIWQIFLEGGGRAIDRSIERAWVLEVSM